MRFSSIVLLVSLIILTRLLCVILKCLKRVKDITDNPFLLRVRLRMPIRERFV
jgi:hypothetical protein